MDWKEKIRHWCAKGERSTFETKTKLHRLGISTDDTTEFLKVLEKEGFISEERYINAFIHDHFKFKNWGPRKIYHGLKKKGCPSHLIQKAISTITSEEFEAALQRTLDSRFTLYPEEHKTHRERLIRYLQNRGYTLDKILTALSRL